MTAGKEKYLKQDTVNIHLLHVHNVIVLPP